MCYQTKIIITVSIIAQPRKSLSSNISYKMVMIVVPRAAFFPVRLTTSNEVKEKIAK